MSANKQKDIVSESTIPSAPLYPVQSQPLLQSNDNPSVPPPPPYFEPLPQLHPPQPNYIQPTIYISPINMPPPVGSSPTRLRCPNCSADIVTQINYKSGCMTWAICGSICAIGLFAPCAWLGCQFIPFCIDSCKDVQHNCSNCKAYIGTFDRMK